MRFGIDIDGCVANLDEEMSRRMHEAGYPNNPDEWYDYFIEVNHPEVPMEWIIDQFADKTLWLNAKPYEDAWHMVNKWFGNGDDIFFITARPADTLDVTYRWLDEWNIGFNDAFCGAIKYEKNVYVDKLSLDVFIEDFADEARIISESCTSFLIDKSYNRKYEIGDAERAPNFYHIDKWRDDMRDLFGKVGK